MRAIFSPGQRVLVCPVSHVHGGGMGTIVRNGLWHETDIAGRSGDFYQVKLDGDAQFGHAVQTRTIHFSGMAWA